VILERADGRIVAIEVKLARDMGDGDVAHLRWLADRIGDELLDAVIVTTGPEAYRRADGIAVVPAALRLCSCFWSYVPAYVRIAGSNGPNGTHRAASIPIRRPSARMPPTPLVLVRVC
jgi:hypothetical protein